MLFFRIFVLNLYFINILYLIFNNYFIFILYLFTKIYFLHKYLLTFSNFNIIILLSVDDIALFFQVIYNLSIIYINVLFLTCADNLNFTDFWGKNAWHRGESLCHQKERVGIAAWETAPLRGEVNMFSEKFSSIRRTLL